MTDELHRTFAREELEDVLRLALLYGVSRLEITEVVKEVLDPPEEPDQKEEQIYWQSSKQT